jgi:hypothetical protein
LGNSRTHLRKGKISPNPRSPPHWEQHVRWWEETADSMLNPNSHSIAAAVISFLPFCDQAAKEVQGANSKTDRG